MLLSETIKRLSIAGVIVSIWTGSAGAVTVSPTPLFVSTSVRPNVMLQFDNSGSMANIIWDQRYDPTVDYDPGDYFVATRNTNDGGRNYYCPDDARYFYQCIELPSPLGASTRYVNNYLDWVAVTYDDGSDLTDGRIPQKSRIQVAREVAKQVVTDNENVNFGLARFNAPDDRSSGPGGTIVAACGAGQSTLIDTINDFGPRTNTPLAETYYEITRYFRGMSAFQGDGRGVAQSPYQSPVEYSCQRNFVITITDGLPTYDAAFSDGSNDDAIPGDDGQTLPNWDGKSPQTSGSPYPQYSDGEGGSVGEEGSTLYFDDLAKFGYDLELGSADDSDEFEQQRLETYAVGFTVDNQMLEDAAEYGNGEYFTAGNLEELTTALQGALSSIADKTSTAASLSATSTQASTETRLFRATFNSGDWNGELEAYNLGSDPSLTDPIWQASAQIPEFGEPGGRSIYTVDGNGGGIRFQWSSLGDSARTAIGGEAVLEYIRGSNENTKAQGGDFRNRSSSLGDIVHSTPAFAGDQSYGYAILPSAAGSSYRSFVNGKSETPDVVLVGANDGMLHAFNVDDGVERFAYVPRQSFGKLGALTDPDYDHRYYVDGSPAVSDAYLNSGWATVAVTTLGRGGKGAFALDITSPGSFDAASDVLWEIAPDTVSGTYGDYLGEGMGKPAVVRLESGDWVALLGNGYNSASGNAALVVVNLSTGEVLDVLDTGAGNDNGLATPLAIDRDRNGSVDTVYAGDLKGNLWKFDLSGGNSDEWAVDYGGNPLFVARTSDGGSRQPITARPDAIAHPSGGVLVVLGTGRYLSESDAASDAEQSIYGIWDTQGARLDSDGDEVLDERVSGFGDLVEQTLRANVTVAGRDGRVLTRNEVDYGTDDGEHRGWVFDLNRAGERITRDIEIFDGKAIMVSNIPNTDPCSFGGDSSLIELNPVTGTQFKQPILDLNEDDEFDTDDGANITDGEGGETRVYPGIADLDVGLATSPYILNRDDGNQTKLVTGSNLKTGNLDEKGFLRPGRASWLQRR